MKTISVCMIVRDEEQTIERCLKCASAFADELILVDTGSTDRTPEICRKFTRFVYEIPWERDFAKARNVSFSKAHSDYLMWLDADDVILPEDIQKIRELKHTLTDEDVVYFPYHTAFDAEGQPIFSFYRERLLRRESHFVWEGRVHECITPRGKLLYCDIAIRHQKVKPRDPDRNVSILQELVESGTANPRELYYYGRELFINGDYEKASEQFRTFLALPKGWRVNSVEASILLAECDRHLRPQDRLPHLMAALIFETPRARLCCAIGEAFLDEKNYDQAIFWYENALRDKTEMKNGGFFEKRYTDLVPLLQLCVCYDRIGEHALAEEYNKRAALIEPNHPSVLYNQTYFHDRTK